MVFRLALFCTGRLLESVGRRIAAPNRRCLASFSAHVMRLEPASEQT